jgi:hypothetical protein
VTTALTLTPRESLAEDIWAAVLWHASPDATPGTADAYEALYDAVTAAPDEAAALELVRAAIKAGTADAGDLPGITEDETKNAAGNTT